MKDKKYSTKVKLESELLPIVLVSGYLLSFNNLVQVAALIFL